MILLNVEDVGLAVASFVNSMLRFAHGIKDLQKFFYLKRSILAFAYIYDRKKRMIGEQKGNIIKKLTDLLIHARFETPKMKTRIPIGFTSVALSRINNLQHRTRLISGNNQ